MSDFNGAVDAPPVTKQTQNLTLPRPFGWAKPDENAGLHQS